MKSMKDTKFLSSLFFMNFMFFMVLCLSLMRMGLLPRHNVSQWLPMSRRSGTQAKG